jgi:hypothetical protein
MILAATPSSSANHAYASGWLFSRGKRTVWLLKELFILEMSNPTSVKIQE